MKRHCRRLEQSRLLKEQGYVEPGSLAATYDELAQAHAGLGAFRDALRLCELALAENGRFAESRRYPGTQ